MATPLSELTFIGHYFYASHYIKSPFKDYLSSESQQSCDVPTTALWTILIQRFRLSHQHEITQVISGRVGIEA